MSESRRIHRTVLDNGLTLVTEEIPTVRSASLGIWVRMGSRYEAPSQAGISHFIEHMLFQGTESMDSRDIAQAIDAMGGQLDAFTTKENACYYANVLDEHLDEALELLSDIVLNPLFDPREMEAERGVILEELAAVEDVPEDLLFEEFLQTYWFGHPLGSPVLGYRETVESFEPHDLAAYFRRAYEPGNVLVAAAGNLSHEAMEAWVQERFGDLENGDGRAEVSSPMPHQHFRVLDREQLEQVHVGVGTLGLSAVDPRRYVGYVLNALLGGSVSSRLFQRVREEHGLAYNVYSSLGPYADAGYLWIYAGTRADAAETVVELILEELSVLCEIEVAEVELERMKSHLKGSFMLGLETTIGRMSSLAQEELYFGRPFDLDEILESIEAVTVEQVLELARELFHDRGICIDLLARRDVASQLEDRYRQGVSLPGGAVLTPSE